MRYFAFQWHIGIGYKYSDGTYAGTLYTFSSARNRDKWVDLSPEIESLDCRQVVTKQWVKKHNLEDSAIHEDLINWDN